MHNAVLAVRFSLAIMSAQVWRLGEHQQFDLGYRFQHLSNGGIKKPNQGINLNEVHFIYHF